MIPGVLGISFFPFRINEFVWRPIPRDLALIPGILTSVWMHQWASSARESATRSGRSPGFSPMVGRTGRLLDPGLGESDTLPALWTVGTPRLIRKRRTGAHSQTAANQWSVVSGTLPCERRRLPRPRQAGWHPPSFSVPERAGEGGAQPVIQASPMSWAYTLGNMAPS